MKKSLEIGSKHGELTVLEYIGKKGIQNMYLCECSCGVKLNRSFTRIVNEHRTHRGCKNLQNLKHHNLKYTPEEASFRSKASNYKAIAKKREHSFELTMEQTIDFLKGNCHYCGSAPLGEFNAIVRNRNYKSQYNFYEKEEYNIKYSGIDRIDSSLGYSLNNCVSCCRHCNTAKLDRTYEEFKEWVTKVYNNLIKNNG